MTVIFFLPHSKTCVTINNSKTSYSLYQLYWIKSRNISKFSFFYFFKFFFWNFFLLQMTSWWNDVMMMSWLKWRIVCTLHSSDLVFRIFIYFLHRICSELTRRPRIWSYNKWYLNGSWDYAQIGWWYSIMRERIWKAKSVPNYIGCFDSEFILHKEKTLRGLILMT